MRYGHMAQCEPCIQKLKGKKKKKRKKRKVKRKKKRGGRRRGVSEREKKFLEKESLPYL